MAETIQVNVNNQPTLYHTSGQKTVYKTADGTVYISDMIGAVQSVQAAHVSELLANSFSQWPASGSVFSASNPDAAPSAENKFGQG